MTPSSKTGSNKHHNTKHGGCVGGESPEYSAWASMKKRCLNPKHKAYKNYGGRGIKVCARWLNSFEDFIKDMGNKPTSKHTLDRIDNNKDYTPENCKWSTYKEQNNNRRFCKVLEFEGGTGTLQQWSEFLNINKRTLQMRIAAGWGIAQSLTTKVREHV